ncbi:MAG: di-trans,poly-cis-decaprenylcistransferase [Oscillospiraceae bacterium]|jgi:undecaprenyl diphosphate synthase|nr:di-trans,poly-cis-decaprenylcistransferase [Oscillospiraceae bacterium]
MAPIGKNKARAGEERLAVPRHVAIIMDGNGRWAKKRGLPRTAGHSAGAEAFRKITKYCRDLGMEYLTVYAFSTENWKRSADEVGAIMGLLEKYLYEAIEDMEKEHTRLFLMGDLGRLSPALRELSKRALKTAETVRGLQVNVCFNYGGRDEILRAARRYAEDYAAGRAGEIDEAGFSKYLYSADIPDPDLIIRPSGEIRTSNFLLWQSAYSEYYFTDTLWPDFDERELDKALVEYGRRSRRFGGV